MTVSTWQRLNQIVELLVDSYPDGLTTPEIGKRLNVTRQTAHKDIHRLEDLGVPISTPEHPHQYTINPRDYIQPLRLTLPQAWLLYLPLRRMVRAQLHHEPLVLSLLKRLALTLNETLATYLIPEETSEPSQGNDILKTLVDAWHSETLVEIRYHPLNKQPSRHLIAPYWFEPAVWSDSIYLIAALVTNRSNLTPITLKLNRIEAAALRQDSFVRPNPEFILERLQHTWGIWMGDDPAKVRLRFHNRQRQRLLETRWHPTEQITDEPDGFVIWQAIVDEPQEMLPWIRGWGPDVEVLEPESIRDQIASDANRTANLYGMCEETGTYF